MNPVVYDTRLHWARWHQPTTLLRLASHLRGQGADLKLIDSLRTRGGARLRKSRVAFLSIEGYSIPKWRFGLPRPEFLAQLRALAADGWLPDRVYVECFTTFWWEGTRDTIEVIREAFPDAQVVLVGAYGYLVPDHAIANSGANEVLTRPWDGIASLPADVSLYSQVPSHSYVALGAGVRSPEEVVEEIQAADRLKIGSLAFLDGRIQDSELEQYRAVLERLSTLKLRVNLYALGNLAPETLASNPELPELMRKAGYLQICFSDDRDQEQDADSEQTRLDAYADAAHLCQTAGFRLRSDELCGAVCIGKPGEDIYCRSRYLTLVSHHIGSVIIWPYQPAPGECGDLPIEMQNGKLFPYREANRIAYREYLNAMGLGVVLNGKYREHTFDFLADDLVAQMFRTSLAREAWDPEPIVKGTLDLPVLQERN